MPLETFPAINIQNPISKLILDGAKTVETRTYALPKDYVGVTMFFVETPGSTGGFRARIVAKVIFGDSFKYASKREFRADFARHRVAPQSEWDWSEKPKWGWPIQELEIIAEPIEVTARRGIVFTKQLSIQV